MSSYRRARATLGLTLVLTSAAFADDGFMHTDRATPTPAEAGIIHTEWTTGEINTAGIMWPDATAPVVATGLGLVQSLLTRL